MTYRREIDGLRAIALLPVMLFHAGFAPFGGGFVGVDVFFVISGYLITSIILTDLRAGRFSLAGFYERRARRILPALFVVMAACLPAAWLWLLPGDMKSFSQSIVAVSAFASNVLFFLTTGYFGTTAELKPLLHTWSLAVEEQYTLLFPLLVMAAWSFGLRWIAAVLAVLAAISLAVSHSFIAVDPDFAFYLLPTRGWEILLGAGVAVLRPIGEAGDLPSAARRRADEIGAWGGLALVGWAVLAFDLNTPFPGLAALVPTIGAGLLIACATRYTVAGRLLGSGWLVGIGLVSYSAYLWHQPLFALARHRMIGEPADWVFAALTVAALGLAYLSWKYVEVPVRNRQRLSRPRLLAGVAVSWAALMLFGAAGHATDGFPARVPEDVRTIAMASEDRNPRQADCLASRYVDPRAACVLGHEPRIVGVLAGDSQASAISQPLDEALRARSLGMRQLTYGGCPPVFGVYRAGAVGCTQYNQAVEQWFHESHARHTVVLVARWTLYLEGRRFDNGEGGVEYGDRAYVDALESGSVVAHPDAVRRQLITQRLKETVRSYLDGAARVVLVYPIPEAGWDVPRHAAKRRWFLGQTADVTTSYATYLERNRNAIAALDAVGTDTRLLRVRPDRLFCDTFVKGRCVAQLNGRPLYSDAVHLSNTGARILVDEIVRQSGL